MKRTLPDLQDEAERRGIRYWDHDWTKDDFLTEFARLDADIPVPKLDADAVAADRAALASSRPEPLDAAYRERNAVVAALFRTNGWPVYRIDAPDAPGWFIVYAETPAGQVSWHISADDIDLFDPPVGGATWDGHDTDEKYRRVAALASSRPEPLDVDRLAHAIGAAQQFSGVLNGRRDYPEIARHIAREYDRLGDKG